MKHLYIIRHGETDNNRTHRLQGRGVNASLNELGVKQANAVAKALQSVPIQKVYTSSLTRTIETAQPLLSQKELSFTSFTELDEMSFGDWEGKYFEELMPDIKILQQTWSNGEILVPVPGGESPQMVFERAGNKVKEIVQAIEEEYIAFFVHGRLIRILLSGLLGLGLKNMQAIKHQNGSINHIIWENGEFKAQELNIIDHLETMVEKQ